MHFKKLKVKGDKYDFVMGAYAGPVISKWGLSMRPVIVKDADGWSTYMAEGWFSLEELDEQLEEQDERMIDMTFYPDNLDHGTYIFDTLAEAKRCFTMWQAGRLYSYMDIVFYKLPLELGQEFFTLTWNDNYGTPIRGLKGELTESFKDGMESGEEFSDAAHKRWMAISDKMSGKLDSAFYDQFKASVVPSEDGSMSEGVMEFGDIEVGSSGSFETGCGCLVVIALIIFLMILFS